MNDVANEVNANMTTTETMEKHTLKEATTIDENETDEMERNAIEINLDTGSSVNLPIPVRINNGFLDSGDTMVIILCLLALIM